MIFEPKYYIEFKGRRFNLATKHGRGLYMHYKKHVERQEIFNNSLSNHSDIAPQNKADNQEPTPKSRKLSESDNPLDEGTPI